MFPRRINPRLLQKLRRLFYFGKNGIDLRIHGGSEFGEGKNLWVGFAVFDYAEVRNVHADFVGKICLRHFKFLALGSYVLSKFFKVFFVVLRHAAKELALPKFNVMYIHNY